MKILQKAAFNILLAILPLTAFSQANPHTSASANLLTADSLFHLKQYTQSLEIYHRLFEQQTYSPSMLLKMAYIQEGLGHLAQSMYFLNLYYLATSDRQALVKIEEVARKNKLAGYEESDSSLFLINLREYQTAIATALMAACLFLLAVMFFQKFKRKVRPTGAAIALMLLLAILGIQNHLAHSFGQGIIAASETYLMSGPSAGSSVVSIVGEGHRVRIIGEKDVWVKVKWHEREAFVKANELLPL